MAWQRRNAPVLLLGAAIVCAAVAWTVAQWEVTFFQDTWAFLLYRQDFSADAFFAPHNEHIVVIPVAITKILLEVFGMTSNTPEQVAMGLTMVAAAILLFVWMRRRIGPWPALMAASLMLFLGAAWPVLLWPFENEFTLPVVFGLAMLLFLDRRDAIGDAWACAMLVFAVLSGSLGLSFVVAAAVDVFLERKSRGWGRAYVFLVPASVYLSWYAGWGHEAETRIALTNVLGSPRYVSEGFASAVGSLAGLSKTPVSGPNSLDWGAPLLVAAIVLAALQQRSRPGFSRGLWPVAAAGLTYWLLAAFNFIPGREATSSRYAYAGALFVLLIGAELLRGVRWSRKGLLIAGVLTICAIGPNIVYLKKGGDWERRQSVLTRADLTALEIARRTVDPGFTLWPSDVAGTASLGIVNAGGYFEAADRWGSPADTIEELEAAPAKGRHYADVVLSRALPISTAVRPGKFPGGGGDCVALPAGGTRGEVELGPGLHRIELAPGPGAVFKLRRFATGEYPVVPGPSPGDSTTLLRIPRDEAPNPWFLRVEASQLARVCPA